MAKRRTKAEMKCVAVHEAAHAVFHCRLYNSFHVKVDIAKRNKRNGRCVGWLPEEQPRDDEKEYMIAMAGWVATHFLQNENLQDALLGAFDDMKTVEEIEARNSSKVWTSVGGRTAELVIEWHDYIRRVARALFRWKRLDGYEVMNVMNIPTDEEADAFIREWRERWR